MWQIDHKSQQSLYQQIVQLVESKATTGELLPGEKLPSERELAKKLKVNRSTIVRAFDELASRGIIIRKRGSGTIINDGEWDIQIFEGINWRHYLQKETLSTEGTFREEIYSRLAEKNNHVIDGYSSELPIELIPELKIPSMNWRDILEEDLHQENLGYIELRKSLQHLMAQEFSYQMLLDEILITEGAQQAIFYIIHALLKKDDIVAIETPSFFYSLPVFSNAGVKTVGVPVDREGIQLKVLEKKFQQFPVKMLFVNPSYQNPTGTSLTLEKRKELVALCKKYQVAIVEDDVFGFLKFSGTKSVPRLKELSEENVIYIGSLTKILGSTIQIGWVNAPKRVLEQMIKVRERWEFSLSIFPQMLATMGLKDQSFTTQLSHLRDVLEKRKKLLVSLLTKELSEEFSFYVPEGGYYIWLTLLQPELSTSDWKALLETELLVMPSFLLGKDKQSMRINYARLSEEDCYRVVEILKQLCVTWRSKNEGVITIK
ncbi:aminotransferase-like domain-containing protein [Vagococcus elongatus]|uniref:HTH gntR-type domain-containing protein n=1 Tax=Vagococcus elongatus TaxID=180344 RepID=A0A430ARS7_9ENTE|nr:PLP-dependent aminotransferase family protein [Vagococcus elongatus]RSU10761.1 hypothetical protein CBF29_09260 [Vagococcus elongatus]